MTRIMIACVLMLAPMAAWSQPVAQVPTPEIRIGGVIGQIVIDNAKLGAEVEQLRQDVAREKARADAAEQKLKDIATPKPEGK